MSLKPCTSEYMISTVRGMGMARSWYPRVVQESFLQSTKDGEISRAPDPVTMIDGDLTWYNNARETQIVVVQVQRSPRTVVAQSPGTVVIHDAWNWAVGLSPRADYPSVVQDAMGGRFQVDRASVSAKELLYGRFFLDLDASQAWVKVGSVDPGESLHFRYIAAVQTPGTWTTPSEFDGRWEAHARWTRLRAMAGPVGSL